MKNKTDNEELNEILSQSSRSTIDYDEVPIRATETQKEMFGVSKFDTNGIQWSSSNGIVFIPTGETTRKLCPGFYEIGMSDSIGLYFEKILIKTEGILEFPDSVSKKVVDEIKLFWESEEKFRKFNITYKRGIMLWGPPGSGKSATLQLVSQDVINRGGIVIKFGNTYSFNAGYRKLKEIQPDIPVVVLMEDIDGFINHEESNIINMLDGLDKTDKIVFLATTNYPERLGPRLMNRPSRFDKRFKVGYPNAEARRQFLVYLLDKHDLDIDIDQWVIDSKDFSIAHLKELFIAVNILGNPYEEAIETLKSMKTILTSDMDHEEKRLGFAREAKIAYR